MSHKRLELFFLYFAHSRSSAAGFNCLKCLFAAVELLDDRIHRGGPDKRLGVGVLSEEKLLNGHFQVFDADKDSAPDSFAGQLSKPALDQIQPTGTGWHVKGS